MDRTANILIVGNEILSGKVQDDNSRFLIGELRGLGVRVREVRVVADDPDVIARAVREMAAGADLLFTSGGVGPTHDDVTWEGVARALSRPLVRNPEFEAVIRAYYREAANDHVLRMADVPEGATLVTEGLRFPQVVVENVWVFPGDPEILHRKFLAVRERFRGRPFHLRRIWTRQDEGEIAAALARAERGFPGVQVGSYPVYTNADYKVLVTVESRDAEAVAGAFRIIEAALDPGQVWRRE